MSEWSHLPNAKHIDDVIASLKAHPNKWKAYPGEWRASWDAAWDVEYDTVLDASQASEAYESAYRAAWHAMVDVADWSARDAASGAILALVAYDDCAKYLDMTSDELRVWIAMSNDTGAILLLPAVIAYEKIKAFKTAWHYSQIML